MAVNTYMNYQSLENVDARNADSLFCDWGIWVIVSESVINIMFNPDSGLKITDGSQADIFSSGEIDWRTA